jgi:hypothetical protein
MLQYIAQMTIRREERHMPHRDWNVKTEARLPRIRLPVFRLGRVEALLGYLVTDGNGTVWAIPETSRDGDYAVARVAAYRLNPEQIDKTLVVGRPEQVFAYRGVFNAPEMIESPGAGSRAYSRETMVNANGFR